MNGVQYILPIYSPLELKASVSFQSFASMSPFYTCLKVFSNRGKVAMSLVVYDIVRLILNF